MKRLLMFLLGAALLAGCGGGGASVPATTHASTPQSGKVTFRIDVPPGSLAAHRRSPQYISPATTQLSIEVYSFALEAEVAGYPIAVPLTIPSGDCSSTVANEYCQVSIELAPGYYAVGLTAEDANGTALAYGLTISVLVQSAQNTSIPITLSGIPHSLQIAPAGLAVHGPSPSGFVLYGSAPQSVVVTALDADGNIIVGPGAPTYTTSIVSGSGWSVSTPSSTSPNQITITPPGTNNSGATISVSANFVGAVCSNTGAVCTTSFAIKNDIQTLYVSNFAAGTITEYQSPYTGGAAATIGIGLNEPIGLALDGAGDLFAANYGNNTVTEYAPNAGAPSLTITSGIRSPNYVLVDGSGNLFVSNFAGNTVTVYAPPYTGAPTTISTGVTRPSALALDHAGNLFVANNSISTVTEYVPPYTGSAVATIGTGVSQPLSLALDAAGDLFVGNGANGEAIEEYAPPYTGSPVTIGSGGGPNALAIDPAGNLFAAYGFSSQLAVYAPPYTGTPALNAVGGSALVLDGAGNAIVTNPGSQNVLVFAPPYDLTPAATITGVNSPNGLALTP